MSGSRLRVVAISLSLIVAGCGAAGPSVSPSPSVEASPGETAIETPTTTAGPTPTPVGTLVPAETPTPPDATQAPTLDPGTLEVPDGVLSVLLPIGTSGITVTDRLRARSKPEVSETSFKHTPLLPTGTRFRVIDGPVAGSGYWWYRIDDVSITFHDAVGEAWVASANHDGTPWIGPAAEACQAFAFPAREISITTLAELDAGFTGTWVGCVTTPWVPPYWVTITFRDDGTYSAAAQAHQLGYWQPAFYYGMDADSPAKRYWLNDLQDSLKGLGEIDIVFDVGSINRGQLRNIRLMGDQLEFEFFHRGEYGPLTFRLVRFRGA